MKTRFLFGIICWLTALSANAAERSYNLVFIGNSITYGALHKQRDLTAPPVQCAKWLSEQEGVDTVYFRNCGHSGRTTYHFLPRAVDRSLLYQLSVRLM